MKLISLITLCSLLSIQSTQPVGWLDWCNSKIAYAFQLAKNNPLPAFGIAVGTFALWKIVKSITAPYKFSQYKNYAFSPTITDIVFDTTKNSKFGNKKILVNEEFITVPYVTTIVYANSAEDAKHTIVIAEQKDKTPGTHQLILSDNTKTKNDDIRIDLIFHIPVTMNCPNVPF